MKNIYVYGEVGLTDVARTGRACGYSDISLAVVKDALEQPIKGDIALVARTILSRWTVKLFMARIAQRVANTGRRVAPGRWLLHTAAIAAKTKRFHLRVRCPLINCW